MRFTIGCLFCLLPFAGLSQTIVTIPLPVCEGEQKTGTADDLVHLQSYNGIATSADGTTVFVTEWNSGYVLSYSRGAQCLKPWAGSSKRYQNFLTDGARYINPHGVVCDADGNLYVALYNGAIIRKYDTTGHPTLFAGNGRTQHGLYEQPATTASIGQPNGMAMGQDGALYIADEANDVITKVTPDGQLYLVAGIPGKEGYGGDHGIAANATFNDPWGLAFGNEGTLFVADSKNNVVRKIDINGVVTTYAGTGKKGYDGDGEAATAALLNTPKGLATDKEGNLYIADEGNHTIRKVAINGIIETIAGDGTKGSAENGIPAKEARLNHPRDVAIDANGSLWIIDFDNDPQNRIHRIDFGEQPEDVNVALSAEKYIQINNCSYTSASVVNSQNIVVLEQTILNKFARIPIGNLPPGNYTLVFRKNGGSKTIHFNVSGDDK